MARTAYYDRIAKQWHRTTGYSGGAFKRYVLNDRILEHIAQSGGVAGRDILELGAGNGYFMPLLLRRFSGQPPGHLVITDQSEAQLAIAQTSCGVEGGEYLTLDVQDPFPLEDASFDLVLATMLLNELTAGGLQVALGECRRVLHAGGQLLAVVPHPAFVLALTKKGALTDFGRGLFAMPSAEGLKLPVSRRSQQAYVDLLTSSGFAVAVEDVLPDERTLHEKASLKMPRDTPMALLLDCTAI